MTSMPKVVHVEPGSALDRALQDAGDTTIEIERDGVRYRLERLPESPAEELWEGYDPELALAGMRTAAGSWSDVDPEHLKAEIYRAREEGSRPSDRP